MLGFVNPLNGVTLNCRFVQQGGVEKGPLKTLRTLKKLTKFLDGLVARRGFFPVVDYSAFSAFSAASSFITSLFRRCR